MSNSSTFRKLTNVSARTVLRYALARGRKPVGSQLATRRISRKTALECTKSLAGVPSTHVKQYLMIRALFRSIGGAPAFLCGSSFRTTTILGVVLRELVVDGVSVNTCFRLAVPGLPQRTFPGALTVCFSSSSFNFCRSKSVLMVWDGAAFEDWSLTIWETARLSRFIKGLTSRVGTKQTEKTAGDSGAGKRTVPGTTCFE
mmetsp:Transcript_21075/g.50975  ORF Transcript_21075/g.50975 Transcript_21075/m.50975 type:complete len:201 (+) Transcript_21075:833-1435(+)